MNPSQALDLVVRANGRFTMVALLDWTRSLH